MITEVLDQIAGNAVSSDVSIAAQDCAAATIQLVYTLTNAGPSNTNVHKVVDAWKAAIHDLLGAQNNFVLTILASKFYCEDAPAPKSDEAVNHFIQALTQRRIRKITFERGCDDADLDAFATVIKTFPEELKQSGGLALFCKELKMKHLILSEVRYAPGDERGGGEYWERKSAERGLDPVEVLAFCSGRARQPRLVPAERAILFESLKEARFLTQLIWRAALGDSGQNSPEALEFLRVAKRAQYLLTLGGSLTPDEIANLMTKVMQAYEQPFRLALLKTQLSAQGAGAEYFDERILDFQLPEYAEYVVRGRERDGDWKKIAEPMRLTPGEAINVCRAVEGRLWTSSKLKVDALQVANEVETLQAALTRPFESPRAATTDESLMSRIDHDPNLEYLQAGASAFAQDFTEAYTFILLHLYYSALDGPWARSLLDRLAAIIQGRLELGHFDDVVLLLRSIYSNRFASERIAVSKSRLREAFKNTPKDSLTKFLGEQLVAGNQMLLELVPVIVDLCGEDEFQKMVESLLARETDQPSPIAVSLLARHLKLTTACLVKLAESNNPWVRVRCYELLCTTRDPILQDIALKGVADRNGNIRFLAYLAMGKGASPRGVAQLLETAAAKHKTGKVMVHRDCLAAIFALGELRCAQAVPALRHILKSKRWRKMPWYELKVAAAMALRRIGTTESIELLHHEIADLDATIVAVVVRRSLRLIGLGGSRAKKPVPAKAKAPQPMPVAAAVSIAPAPAPAASETSITMMAQSIDLSASATDLAADQTDAGPNP